MDFTSSSFTEKSLPVSWAEPASLHQFPPRNAVEHATPDLHFSLRVEGKLQDPPRGCNRKRFDRCVQVESEDVVFTLETIVEKFGEEMAPFAVGLCQHLSQAFWRLQVRGPRQPTLPAEHLLDFAFSHSPHHQIEDASGRKKLCG